MHTNKIAVLGSNSFAGSAYVNHALSEGHHVLGISRSCEPKAMFLPYKKNARLASFQFRQLDLNQDFGQLAETLSSFKPEIIVDFAAQSMVAESWLNPEHWYQTNVVSKVRLHEFLRQQKCLQRYVRISTPEVYGSSESLIDETAPYNPSTPYAVSQAAIDMNLSVFHRNYGFPVLTGRFANFYGPHQQLYRIIPKTILSAMLQKKLPLHGGGYSVRAFIHSDDLCSAIDCLISDGALGETYHFSPNEFVSIRELVEMISQRLGFQFEDVVEESGDRLGKDKAYLMSAMKAESKLGWKPRVTLSQGLRGTIDWVEANLDLMSQMPWVYTHKN